MEKKCVLFPQNLGCLLIFRITRNKLMTCFWDGLLKVLAPQDFHIIGKRKPKKATDFIAMLQSENTLTRAVGWSSSSRERRHIEDNFSCPTELQLKENYEAVKSFRPRSAQHGYDCSAFDPFLFLVAQIFEVSIVHKGAFSTSTYQNLRSSRKTLRVSSDLGHFVGHRR